MALKFVAHLIDVPFSNFYSWATLILNNFFGCELISFQAGKQKAVEMKVKLLYHFYEEGPLTFQRMMR